MSDFDYIWVIVSLLCVFAFIIWLVKVINKVLYIAWRSLLLRKIFSFWKPLFQVKEDFFTIAEKQFYNNLKNVLFNKYENRFDIYPKTRLSDIFDTSYSKEYFLKSHVDFLVVDKNLWFKPVLGIEVDWDSHRYRNQKKSDKFKNRIFEDAGLRLVRVQNEYASDINLIYSLVSQYLS